MPSGYIQTLIFPCGHCNWPIPYSAHSYEKRERYHFAREKADLQCPQCGWKGPVLGSQAEIFRQDKWNLEIHSGLHIDKPVGACETLIDAGEWDMVVQRTVDTYRG